MGRLAGVTREQWGRYERGLAVPGGEVLAKVAQAGMDIAYVATGIRGDARPALEAAELLLLENYRRCGEQARANLLQLSVLLAAGLAAPAHQSLVQHVNAPVNAGGVAGGNIINNP